VLIMKKILATAVLAGTVLTTALASAGTASAAQVGTYCSAVRECKLPSGFFPGGTISIDVDALLPFNPQPSNSYFRWTLGKCWGEGYLFDPPRSWTCTLPASYYTLTATSSLQSADFDLGLRW
jgi:hypothetical protein